MKTLSFLLLLVGGSFALGQNVRFDSSTGLLGGNVSVCSSPANGLPCTNYATTYDSAGNACSNSAQDTPAIAGSRCQATTDSQGHPGFWIPAGTYDYTLCTGGDCRGPFTVTVGSRGSSGPIAIGPTPTFDGSWPANPSLSFSVIRPPDANNSSDFAIWSGQQPTSWVSGNQDVGLAIKSENVFASIGGKAIAVYGISQGSTGAYQNQGVGGQGTNYLTADGSLIGAIGGYFQSNVKRNGFTIQNNPNSFALETFASGDQGVSRMAGLAVFSNSINSGGTMTGVNDGIFISSQAGVSSVRNAAIEIADQGTASTDYAIYVAGGRSLFSGPIQSASTTFSSLAACASGTEGSMRAVIDSSTATWGATITGGSTNHVLAYCDGTNWTVAAK